jgi:hypothetical protein
MTLSTMLPTIVMPSARQITMTTVVSMKDTQLILHSETGSRDEQKSGNKLEIVHISGHPSKDGSILDTLKSHTRPVS